MSSWWNQQDLYEEEAHEGDHMQNLDPEEARRMIKEYHKRQREKERKRHELESAHMHEHRMKHHMAYKYLEDTLRRDQEIRERDAKLLTKKGYGNKNNFKRLLPGPTRWRYNIRGEQEPPYVPGIYLYDTERKQVVGYSTYN